MTLEGNVTLMSSHLFLIPKLSFHRHLLDVALKFCTFNVLKKFVWIKKKSMMVVHHVSRGMIDVCTKLYPQ